MPPPNGLGHDDDDGLLHEQNLDGCRSFFVRIRGYYAEVARTHCRHTKSNSFGLDLLGGSSRDFRRARCISEGTLPA